MKVSSRQTQQSGSRKGGPASKKGAVWTWVEKILPSWNPNVIFWQNSEINFIINIYNIFIILIIKLISFNSQSISPHSKSQNCKWFAWARYLADVSERSCCNHLFAFWLRQLQILEFKIGLSLNGINTNVIFFEIRIYWNLISQI